MVTKVGNICLEIISQLLSIKLYFYPASFIPHKNHLKLIKGFQNAFYNSPKPIKLILTISPAQLPINFLLNNKSLFLCGKLSPYQVLNTYKFIDYLIYPSLIESLGLPLLEAKINNLPVIASNFDYVYEVCDPYLTFNPHSIDDITRAVIESISFN